MTHNDIVTGPGFDDAAPGTQPVAADVPPPPVASAMPVDTEQVTTERVMTERVMTEPVPDGPSPNDDLSRLRTLLAAADVATIIVGIDGTVIDSNEAATRLFPSRSLPDDPDDGMEMIRNVIEQVPQQLLVDPEGGVWEGEIDLGLPGALGVVHAATVLVRHDPESASGGFIGVMCRDVTDERSRAAELLRLLEHDPTTGLLNRTAAIERTTHALRRINEDGGEVAILMIDIDRLRDVNDALGHEVGDRLLSSTARRLATAVRPNDTIARIGGDEFIVLCYAVPDSAVAMELADRVRRALTGRLTIKQLELDVSVSVGVSITDDELRAAPPDQGAIQLLSHADTAVHAAKQAGTRSNRDLHQPAAHPRQGPHRTGSGAVQGASRGPATRRVPGDLLGRLREGRGRRGTRAVEPSPARPDRGSRVHPRRRGNRRDRSDRRLGPATGVRHHAPMDRRRCRRATFRRARQRVPPTARQLVVRQPRRRCTARVPIASTPDRARSS